MSTTKDTKITKFGVFISRNLRVLRKYMYRYDLGDEIA